jgi:hypothetical protein
LGSDSIFPKQNRKGGFVGSESRRNEEGLNGGGKFDNAIATENQLGANRVIVPVQIIGDQDGQWDCAAWKTDAYGNPLKGFTALP